ncbi:MAG: hypothetical protein ACI9OJ_000310 [Myxococcota bacterium]
MIGCGGAAADNEDFYTQGFLQFDQQMGLCHRAAEEPGLLQTDLAAIGVFPLGLNPRSPDAGGWSTYANFDTLMYNPHDISWVRPLLHAIDRKLVQSLSADDRSAMIAARPIAHPTDPELEGLRVIDPRRIAFVGHSSGACLGYKAVWANRTLFSALVSVNGSGGGWLYTSDMQNEEPPYWNLPGVPVDITFGGPDLEVDVDLSAPNDTHVHTFTVNSTEDDKFLVDGGASVNQSEELAETFAYDPPNPPPNVIGGFPFLPELLPLGLVGGPTYNSVLWARADVNTDLAPQTWATHNATAEVFYPADFTDLPAIPIDVNEIVVKEYVSPVSGAITRHGIWDLGHPWPSGSLFREHFWPFIRDNPKPGKDLSI